MIQTLYFFSEVPWRFFAKASIFWRQLPDQPEGTEPRCPCSLRRSAARWLEPGAAGPNWTSSTMVLNMMTFPKKKGVFPCLGCLGQLVYGSVQLNWADFWKNFWSWEWPPLLFCSRFETVLAVSTDDNVHALNLSALDLLLGPVRCRPSRMSWRSHFFVTGQLWEPIPGFA